MGATTLRPGEETTVSIAMAMHPGMEGPHLFRITVPIDSSEGQTTLPLVVRAHFE